MSRAKITEYKAKKLILGDAYEGVSLVEGSPLPEGGLWVVKVDQGVKKRMKQGLVKVKQEPSAVPAILQEWRERGFSSFVMEPFLPHEESEERYLSLERVREGIRLLYAESGGIEIESNPEAVRTILLREKEDVASAAKETSIPETFLRKLVDTFEASYFAFLEINPIVIRGDEVFLLDAAVLVDDAGAFFARSSWSEEDLIGNVAKHPQEEAVAELQKTTPASLKLTVLNPDGSLVFLLSSGGGSIVVADEAALLGHGKDITNYGEYSGGPSREETYLYAKEILDLLLKSKAPTKALVIAGGIANFTDVKKTFAGIVDALSEVSGELSKAGVKVFVRRGGPNEEAGLSNMRSFLEEHGLLGSVYGSETVITQAVDDAVAFIEKV